MKRLILIVLLAVCGTLCAQDVVRDSVAATTDTLGIKDNAAIDEDDDDNDDEENVIGAKEQPKKRGKKEANVLGAPVYYDAYGNVVGSGETSDIYHRPKHHYLNDVGRRFCSVFLEGELLAGRHDVAFGGNITYLPKRWGFYVSALGGLHHSYLTLGAALRLSSPSASLDWQLYGGVGGGGRHLGGEVGIRMALPKRSGKFCWTSVSMGYANFGGYGFITAGLSLDMIGLMGATLLLF